FQIPDSPRDLESGIWNPLPPRSPMPAKSPTIAALLLAALPLAAPAADAKKKVTYQDVSAIFQARCNSCHNGDKQKGGLNLETFGAATQGGASGKVIEAGDLENSRLWQLVSHA